LVSPSYRIKNVITFYYNGKGIPIVKHEEQKTFIPSMIFDPLIPSFNCSDEEEIVTGGLNCYGIKLANIFSTAFELETASTDLCLRFKQTWTDNMTIAGTPTTRKSKFT
jgi:DNA topoisomerase-2